MSDVLNSVKKMEESLKRLKQARKTTPANPIGPGGGMSDDDKIRLQLALDVEYLGEQVTAEPSSGASREPGRAAEGERVLPGLEGGVRAPEYLRGRDVRNEYRKLTNWSLVQLASAWLMEPTGGAAPRRRRRPFCPPPGKCLTRSQAVRISREALARGSLSVAPERSSKSDLFASLAESPLFP